MGNVWLPFHERKLRQLENINPMKKFSMMIVGQHLGIPFHQKKLRQMGSVNCPMMKFPMMIQIRLTIIERWPVLDTLPPKKAEKNGKCQPHEEILNDDSWPTLDPLPPKKAETNGKCQSYEDIINDDSRPALDPLPTKKKRSVGWVYLSEEGFKASRTPVCVPVVLADDQGHPTDLFLTISVQQRNRENFAGLELRFQLFSWE